jgi:glutamine synthetase adenylyltransferase
MMDLQERENFITLTEAAFQEEDSDKFLECLMKRDPYITSLLKNDPEMFGDMAEECLLRETLILERLEDERRETIEKMDRLSKNMKAVRKYAAQFPLPPTPSFLNKIG